MAFCPNCGASLESNTKFCPNCGSPVQAPPAAPEPPVQAAAQAAQAVQEAPEFQEAPPAPAAQDFTHKVAHLNDTPDTTSSFSSADVANNKVMAILSYFWILFLIPLFAAKESPFARFHANQGLLLFIWSIIVMILRKIWWPLGAIGGIISFILFIIGIVNAANGRAKELPIIGKFRLIK